MNDTQNTEFQEFPKMARLSREVVITEKIDGTNAQLLITEHGDIFVGSRTRWITPQDDNFGFARWVEGNKSEVLQLGAGRHFGEWWGAGIQRAYGLTKGDKRLSLFNTTRWVNYGEEPQIISSPNAKEVKYQEVLPEIIKTVPELYRGMFDTETIDGALINLKLHGSWAMPSFMNPEGIIVFHTAAGIGFKRTIEHDDIPKSKIK